MKWQEIFWFLIPGVIQWPFYGPWGVKYYSTETQTMAIFLWNWYKTGQNVTLTVPLTYFWAFYTWNGGNCLRFDTRAHLFAFLWPPEGQILPNKDSKEVYFWGKSIKNLVKTSPQLSPKLTFGPFTHAVVRIGWDLKQRGLLLAFWGTLWGQSWCCGGPKTRLILSKINKKWLISNIL